MNKYQISNHYDGDEFFTEPKIESLNIFQVMGHVLWGRNGDWPDHVEYPKAKWREAAPNEVSVTWVGHATALIQIGKTVLLTDPVWSTRVGPTSLTGPKRVSDPGINLNEIPRVDYVLISHDHYDHLDLPTIREISNRFHPLFLVPLGIENVLRSVEGISVRAMDWWETYLRDEKFQIYLVPAQHNSGRGLFDHNKTLWAGFVIKSANRQIYFAGDTAWGKHFAEIKKRLGSVDIALLPIGAYEPQEKMKRFHINPAEALIAAGDLSASHLIPIHYDTFQLTAEDFGQPLKDLYKAMTQDLSSKIQIEALKPGEAIQLGPVEK